MSLAQIHAALTYYYENQEQVDAAIRTDFREANRLAVEVADPELRRRLLALKRDQ